MIYKIIRWIFGWCDHDDVIIKEHTIKSDLDAILESEKAIKIKEMAQGARKYVTHFKCNKCGRVRTHVVEGD